MTIKPPRNTAPAHDDEAPEAQQEPKDSQQEAGHDESDGNAPLDTETEADKGALAQSPLVDGRELDFGQPVASQDELPLEDMDLDGALDDAWTRIEELEKENAEQRDRLLRALADAENTRRRAARDREDAENMAG